MKIIVEAANLEELKLLLELLTCKMESARGRHIDELQLNGRTSNCLLLEGITTVDQLSRMSDADLARIPNIGRNAIKEIRSALHTLGQAS